MGMGGKWSEGWIYENFKKSSKIIVENVDSKVEWSGNTNTSEPWQVIFVEGTDRRQITDHSWDNNNNSDDTQTHDMKRICIAYNSPSLTLASYTAASYLYTSDTTIDGAISRRDVHRDV